MFEKGRAEILDDVLSLHDITPKDWEKKLYERMWQTISYRVVDDIYISAAQNNSPGKFNTIVDIKLKHWAEKSLASTSIQVGYYLRYYCTHLILMDSALVINLYYCNVRLISFQFFIAFLVGWLGYII